MSEQYKQEVSQEEIQRLRGYAGYENLDEEELARELFLMGKLATYCYAYYRKHPENYDNA